MKYYWYEFTDGYSLCVRGLSKQELRVEESEKVVMYWNENLFLSFSRSALVEKANQIKQEWLQTQYDNISKIARIDIRR